jgi:hypothetical protein
MDAKEKESVLVCVSPPRALLSVAAIVLALAALTGCQGISTGKPAAQGSQDTLTGGLTATPLSVAFGNVQIGTSQSQTVTLGNTSTSTVNVTDATVTGTGFSTSGLSTPLALSPGQSAAFSVVFAPQSAGGVTGNLALINDGSTGTVNVALSGTGATPAGAQLQVAPSTTNIGNVTVGTSGTQTGTLTATGGNVTVSSVSVGGSEFTVSGIPVTIAAGQSANFAVTFTPQSSGAASVTAVFTSNASNSSASVTLTGTGVAASAHTVNLSWDASTSPGIIGYNVYRRTGSSGSFAKINTAPDPLTSYADSSVADGQTYYYETTSVNSSNEESVASTPVKAIIPAP